MGFKSLGECERILIDTTPLIDAINADFTTPERSLTLDLFEFLCSHKTSHNRVRKFVISTVSIMEIANLSTREDAAEILSNILDIGDAEIRSFGMDEALWVNRHFKGLLSKQQKNDFARLHKENEENIGSARQWIDKDMMIVATAAMADVDVILTRDKKTFKPLADRVGILCALTEGDWFIKSGNNFEFNPAKLPFRPD